MMVCGAALPQADMENTSIAALTASMNALSSSRVSTSINVQSSKTPLIENLSDMLKSILESYETSNGHKPRRILFYHDVVSKGQSKRVIETELALIKDSCASLDKFYKPRVTYVIINTDSQVRMFARSRAGIVGKCLPGTIIDGALAPGSPACSFYLVSGSGVDRCQPTQYSVVYDECFGYYDGIEKPRTITYHLCYAYGGHRGAASLVAPLYNARSAANRARLYLRGENVNATISSKLENIP